MLDVQLIKESEGIAANNLLPILGKKEYLETKSRNYGWLVTTNYILPFFLDKRSIFTRMVFTTGPIGKKEGLNNQDEKKFLDAVVDYVKKHTLCDFIYKAQSNVVFNVCPKESDCVPWGTYEVDLLKSDEELFNSFEGKSRNVIRKAIKEGVEVQVTEDIDLVYQHIKETLERQNSIHYPSRKYLEKLLNLKANVVFLIAMKKNAIQGSLVLLYDQERGYAMYAGSSNAPQTGSLDLLHYKAMTYLQKKNVSTYDFVGTRINIKKGSKKEGIDRFKRKFKPVLKEGYAFRTIIRPVKYYLYVLVSKLYLGLKGYAYTDPISEIKKEDAEIKELLLMGPRYNKKNSQMVSGTIVLFEELLRQMNLNQIKYTIIDTNKGNYTNFVVAYLSILFQFLFKFRSYSHISLHSSKDYMVFGIFIVVFGKIFNKKTSLRKFGGEAANIFTNASTLKKSYLTIIYSRFDNLFFETRYLVSFFSKINKNTFFFPNVRNRILECSLPRKFQKRFVFIGHVLKTKGIDEIIEASKNLDETYTIDIYGLLLDKRYNEEIFHKERVSYKGVLPPDEVLTKLNEYDVVLLPSYKEGYPGIIIEAYSLGIPVVATSLQGISEIVDHYETGILLEPKSVKELIDAIKFFNEENYVEMSKKAYKKFDDFRSDIRTKQFIEILENA